MAPRSGKRAKPNGLSSDNLLDAAVDCILTVGYYRASSNMIARRAGVTWGAIQYHFGTREDLLIAVLQREFGHLSASVSQISIDGATTHEKLMALSDFIWASYGTRRYAAILQIHVDLARNPSVTPSRRKTVAAITEAQWALWRGLMQRTFGPEISDTGLDYVILSVFRAMALGDSISEDGPKPAIADIYVDDLRSHQRQVVAGVAGVIDNALNASQVKKPD